jgi:hypothetical protein
MSNNAVGLEQVGGVSQAAKGMVENSDSRVQAAKALQNVSEATNGRMVGPAGDMMRNAMNANSGATGVHAVRGAEVAQSFAQGEKAVVQGTADSLQQQKVSGQEGENTFQHLNKSIEA